MFVDQWQLCNGLSETTLHSHPVATVLHMVKRIGRRQETSKFMVALLPIFERFRGLQILDLEPQVRLDAT